MVLYIPFGDNQVHGALDKYLIFARRRGKVYAKKYQVPKNPNTADQKAQRLLFKDAVKAWQALTEPKKDVWRAKASGLSATGYNLFIRSYLLNPVAIPLIISRLNNAELLNPRATSYVGWRYYFMASIAPSYYGEVFDNQLYFSSYYYISGSAWFRFRITSISQTINIQKNDKVKLTFDGGQSLTVWMPQFTGASLNLYISDNGSSYYDNAFTQLACRAYN